MLSSTFSPTFVGPALAEAMRGVKDWVGGGSPMLTGILAWATLFSGIVILAIALRTRQGANHARIGLAALTCSLWSAIVLAVLLGDPNAADRVAAGSENATIFALSFCLGLSATLCSSVRARRSLRRARPFPDGADSVWQAVVDATTVNSFLDEMLFDVAGILRSATEARAVHVFKISSVRQRALRIGTIAPAGATAAPARKLSSDEAAARTDLAWRAAVEHDLIVRPSADSGRTMVAVPFDNDGTVLAAVVLDNPALDPGNPTVRRTLLGLGVMVGRAIAAWTAGTVGATYGALCDNLRSLVPALARVDRFERGLPAVATALRGVLDFDYLSVAWLNRARFHEDRASIVMTDDDGPGERMVENRRRWPIIDGSTRRVLALRRALITPDLQMASVDDPTDGEPWECRLGMRSRLVAPIFDGDDVIGAITVAHRRVATYGESDVRLLAVITDVLSLWLQGRQAAREAERARTVETFVRRLWADDAAGRDDATLLNDAKQLLDVSGLRLYRCDPETMTLEEIAAAGRVGRGVAARRLALSQLPWHRCALDSGRPLHVDQGDPESLMNSSEAQQTLAAGVKTGFVIPITSGGRWLGVLDVLEMRDPDRSCLDRMDQFLLQALAATLAGRWDNRFDRGRATGDSRPFPALEVALKELNREIVNPLTSIIGSAELIRHKQPDLRPDTIKYLKTIEQSAARVHESTSGFMMRIDNAIDLRPDRYGWIAEKENTADRRDDNGGRRPVRLTRPVSLLEAADERTIPAASLSATPDRDTLSEWRPTALTNR